MYGRQNDNREIERGLQAFLDYATAPLVANVRRQVYRELDSVLLEKVHWSREANRVVDPEELITYVHNCRINLETSLLVEISTYPATRWLYYVRALPEFAFGLGGNIGSGVYRVTLAEALTGCNWNGCCALGSNGRPNHGRPRGAVRQYPQGCEQSNARLTRTDTQDVAFPNPLALANSAGFFPQANRTVAGLGSKQTKAVRENGIGSLLVAKTAWFSGQRGKVIESRVHS